jgi:hypothetical protein
MAETTTYTENDAMQAGFDAWKPNEWKKPFWVEVNPKFTKAWDLGWDCARTGRELPRLGGSNRPDPVKPCDLIAVRASELLDGDQIPASSLAKDGLRIVCRGVAFDWSGVRPLRIVHPDPKLSDTLQDSFVSEPFREVFFESFRAWKSRRLADLCAPLLETINGPEPEPPLSPAPFIPETRRRRGWFASGAKHV